MIRSTKNVWYYLKLKKNDIQEIIKIVITISRDTQEIDEKIDWDDECFEDEE